MDDIQKETLESFNSQVNRRNPQDKPKGPLRTLTAQEAALIAAGSRANMGFEQVRMIVNSRIQHVVHQQRMVVPSPFLSSEEFGWDGIAEKVTDEVREKIVAHFREAGYEIDQGEMPADITIRIPEPV